MSDTSSRIEASAARRFWPVAGLEAEPCYGDVSKQEMEKIAHTEAYLGID